MTGQEIVVSAAGLVTSLGDLVTSCAAARAGITRRLPLGLMEALPNEPPAELRGHVCAAAVGAEDYGRLVALLVPAISDALGSSSDQLLNSRTQVLVVLPSPDERPGLDDAESQSDALRNGVDAWIVARLQALVSNSVDPMRTVVLRGSHAMVIEALTAARDSLGRGLVDRVILCAADSYLDNATLLSLSLSRRLRHDLSPDGFFPAEAGVALVLETEIMVRRRGAKPLATIGPFAHYPAPERGGPPPVDKAGADVEEDSAPIWTLDGAALADSIEALAREDLVALRSVAGLIDEFNGESARARYLSINLLRGGQPFEHLRKVPRWIPADTFGDVGAATVALQICVAIRAFSRGYAPGRSFLVCATSESGAAGAAVVMAPPG